MRTQVLLLFQLAVGTAGSAIPSVGLLAQTQPVSASRSPETTAAARAEGSGNRWRLNPSLRLDVEYDDNVFLLAPDKKDNVTAPSVAERSSGRYADMESANDVLTTLSAAVAFEGPGLMGKSAEFSPSLDYELYTSNAERSNLRLGLALEQQLWARSRVRLQGKLTPSYFAKNYLTDAVDQDGSGSITPAERRYASGEYRESEFGADYRIPIARATRKHPFGFALRLEGGYYDRSYDAPFEGRDLSGPTAGAGLLFDLGRRAALDVAYGYASLSATTTDQVLLLDEADFGQDFNANGTTVDPDVRVVSGVDRSRREHSVGASLRLDVSKGTDLALGFERRWRRYTSDEPLDVSNNGRRDARNEVSADLRMRLAKHLRLRLGGSHSSQGLNRSGDPGSTGEIDDYSRNRGSLGLSYEL